MLQKTMFTLFASLVLLAAPAAAQKNSSKSEPAKKQSTGKTAAKPEQKKPSQSGDTIQIIDGNSRGSSAAARGGSEPFQPSLKFSNLNLLETKESIGPSKTLVVAWDIRLSNEFAASFTNKVNSLEIELLIQKSKSGTTTKKQSLATSARDFSFIIGHLADESVTVTATVRANCALNGNGGSSQINLSDSGTQRRDPPNPNAANNKMVEVTILGVVKEDAGAVPNSKASGRLVPVRIEWKTKPWGDAKLIQLNAELTTSNTDGSTARVDKALSLTAVRDTLMLPMPEGVFAREFKLKITAKCSFSENGKPATAVSSAIKTGAFAIAGRE
jgi:hypothetical protein